MKNIWSRRWNDLFLKELLFILFILFILPLLFFIEQGATLNSWHSFGVAAPGGDTVQQDILKKERYY